MKKSQKLLFPELEAAEVTELYHNHGTSEQFHSELKSDMGIERLPSGRFNSNALVLHLGMLSYNMLRIIGQRWVEDNETESEQVPRSRRKKGAGRRIRTVMQDLIYMAGRLIKTGGQYFISFGQLNPFAGLWERIGMRLRDAPALA